MSITVFGRFKNHSNYSNRCCYHEEATEGLAPLVREDIWRCLHALCAEGQSILVIDKYVQKLVQLADQHTIIERGKVVWQGGSEALEADRALWQCYVGV